MQRPARRARERAGAHELERRERLRVAAAEGALGSLVPASSYIASVKTQKQPALFLKVDPGSPGTVPGTRKCGITRHWGGC